MASPRAIISVTNDLVTDQRVDKVARTLLKTGYYVTLAGRKKHNSLPLAPRLYQTNRFSLLSEKGPFFYAEFNFRLFLYLLFKKYDLLISNDLDTLLPNFLVSVLRHKPLVYDSHEYFTGVPELESRPGVQKVWKTIERLIFPHLKDIFTVNESIAALYRDEYRKEVRVVRNLPEKKLVPEVKNRTGLGLPEDKPIVLLQGAGINVQRGAEEAVASMEFIENVLLLIIGGGDVMTNLKTIVKEKHLEHKVMFLPKQPFDKLFQYTVCADIGLTLDKDTNINYRFSLPNKLFDYIQAGVPVLASPLHEIKKIILRYDIGMLTENHNPVHIASRIKEMLSDNIRMVKWKENLKLAASDLCWEMEESVLTDVYTKFL
ncbi:MAG: glycosyltransferase [Bacteroidetes bacterium]|nr:glycosyltransferase [Bacteroidota bacterium]